MSKIAGKKTAGILGEELAVNAEKAGPVFVLRENSSAWALQSGSY